jgi:hypothetical protein
MQIQFHQWVNHQLRHFFNSLELAYALIVNAYGRLNPLSESFTTRACACAPSLANNLQPEKGEKGA